MEEVEEEDEEDEVQITVNRWACLFEEVFRTL